MATDLPLPPPGFDELSPDDQIEYVQSLWDRIAAKPEEIPVPEWHREIIRARMADLADSPSDGRTWEEVRKEILDNLKPNSQR